MSQLSIIVLTARVDEALVKLLESMASFPADRTEAIIIYRSPETTQGRLDSAFAPRCPLPVRLLTTEVDGGTKDAIRLGLEAAQGDFIAFAEPGDAFPVLANFPEPFALMRETTVDILHCAMEYKDVPYVSNPWAERLEGGKIFMRYLAETMDEDSLFGKFYARDLCRKAAVSAFPADGHDAACLVMFAAVLHSHAARYAGSRVCGYVRRSRDSAEDGMARLMVPTVLFQYCVPYCAEQGASFVDCGEFDALLEARFTREVPRWLASAVIPEGMDGYSEISRYGDEVDLLRAIILGHPEMRTAKQAYRSARERKKVRRRLAPLWRSFFQVYNTLKMRTSNLWSNSGRPA